MKIKFCSVYTESHKTMKDRYFLPSLQDDFEIIVKELSMPSADYGTPEFNAVALKKVDFILEVISQARGEIFIFSDVDVQFFKPFKDRLLYLLKNKDILFQRDSVDANLCSGFFICRANEKILKLWRDIREVMIKKPSFDDQEALNILLKPFFRSYSFLDKVKRLKRILTKYIKYYNLKYGYLPNEYFTVGVKLQKYWQPGFSIDIPNNIIMHHANWTIGVKNKIALLEYVRRKVRDASTADASF